MIVQNNFLPKVSPEIVVKCMANIIKKKKKKKKYAPK